ncbi:hypothetical protein GGR20_001919 [Devosia subaequoris]|uniref:PepSY domain-containing protein n=1 Tax=Devosia subaequoris TaxID=395930 RepID=A0A7W6IMC9_9HYPH|nr:hypothetical protein [Devosia subaequoris]MBB4052276.1 hypothetical protein [Devosia subaequoris]MCP1209439.1 hypothetical protein [Devosia subaequoris]
MIKNSVIALVTAAALVSGAALPAMAAAAPVAAAEENDFDSDYVLAQLQDQGVNATAVEEWGSYVRAYVVGADGNETMQFFHPVTLSPANI